MSDHQHNHQGCDCVDSATCNCECHPIKAATQILEIQLKESLQAADELAKAAKDSLNPKLDGPARMAALENAIVVYERVRGMK